MRFSFDGNRGVDFERRWLKAPPRRKIKAEGERTVDRGGLCIIEINMTVFQSSSNLIKNFRLFHENKLYS